MHSLSNARSTSYPHAYFFVPVAQAFPDSLGLTLVVLIAIGVIKGKLARLNLLRSVFAGASQQTPRKSDYC